MSAVEIIRELLHHTQQEMYREGAEGRKKIHTKEMVSKKRTKREEELMSGPPCKVQDEKMEKVMRE